MPRSKTVQLLRHVHRRPTLVVSTLTALLAVALAGSLTASGAVDAPKRGGSLVFAHTTNPSSLDPVLYRGANDKVVLWQLYDGLIRLNEKGNFEPSLAESWDVKDPMHLIFKLRPGVKFHDGTPFNAQAVKAHIDRIKDPETRAAWRTDFDQIDRVDAVDAFTVSFVMKAPSANILAVLADTPALIPSPSAVKKRGKDFGLNPAGTGPFVLERWVQDGELLLKRNPSYWESDRPHVDQVVVKIVPDDTVTRAGLRSGTIHAAFRVPSHEVAALRTDPGMKVVTYARTGINYIQFNLSRPPFDKVTLRQAVAYAIDRDAVHKVIYKGLGYPARGLLSPGRPGYYDARFPGITLDLGKVRAKLAEAGKPNGFKFTYLNRNDNEWPELAQILQAQLAQAGIQMEIQTMESRQQLVELREGRYEAAPRGYPGTIDVSDIFVKVYHSKSPLNYGRYRNEAVDRAIESGNGVFDTQKRIQFFRQAEQLIVTDVPTAIIYHQSYVAAHLATVKGIEVIPDGYLRFATLWLDR
jgi:peptide/nickel transport system substrate-binding protein